MAVYGGILIIVMLFIPSTASIANSRDEDVHVVNSLDDVLDLAPGSIGLSNDHHHHISQDFDFQDESFTDEPQSRRAKRSIDGMQQVQGLSASQTCEGIALEWLPPNLPYSSNYKYNHSDFKYYNIYRRNMFFDDVTGMTPHASGSTDPKLRDMETRGWVDRYVTGMVDWFYAVTIVDGKGNEPAIATVVEARFSGAIEKKGKPFVVIQAMKLRGRAIHHSMAFNDKRNEYLVAFDWDANYDGIADHLYALRLNQVGRTVDRTVLNITASLPGWIGGDQGWPSVAFNPMRNEYLVIFHLRSKRHFNNVHVIIGQRLFATRTARSSSPTIAAKFARNIGAREPKLLYNSKTGGYVASIIANKPSKQTVALFFDSIGKLMTSKAACNFKTDAYEHNLFHDSKRDEFYFTCTLENRGVNADFQLRNHPFLVLVTKMDARGKHVAPTLDPNSKPLIGYSAKRYTRHGGYYNKKTDRLVLFWEDMKNGKHTITSTSVLLTSKLLVRNPTKYDCPISLDVKTPVALPMETTGGHYLLWQEKSQFTWNIGGYLMKENFKLRNALQKNPVAVYNRLRRAGFVVWQQDFGRETRLIGRHFIESSSHSCTPRCLVNQRCLVQNACVSTVSGCSRNNGGCSYKCVNIKGGHTSCSCNTYMELQPDIKTCKNIPPCQGMTPLKNALTNKDLFCGRGQSSVRCPANSYCHIHPTDAFAKCCPDVLPEYTGVIASEGILWRVVENQKQRTANIDRMPFTQGLIIVAVGLDPMEKRVYWSDVGHGVIKRAFLNGSREETILKSVKIPDGLYIDVQGRKIYWTDTGLNTIEKANLDGSAHQVILNTGLDEPRAIVLYKKKNLMYWTDWGKTAKIERASLDGAQRKTIVSGGLIWPNGLVLDEERGILYWADAKLNQIETSDLEGRNRRSLTDGTVVRHPFSLAILDNRLFWTDWGTSGVQSIDKNTGKDLRQSFKGFVKPKGLFLFTEALQEQTCVDPGIPDHGGRFPAPDSSARYSIGSTIILTCFPGYFMIGPARRRCLKSGKWDGKVTLCKVPPVLTAFPVNQTINEGDYLVMTCSASVQGKRFKVKWNKNGSPLTPSKSGEYFLGENGHLVFLNVRFDDRGVYECIAKNEAGKVSAKSYLKVRGNVKLKDCGLPRYKTRARIIGGSRADRGAHPWQVMLWDKQKRRHFCGGTLITDRWVVTAAHCVRKIGLIPSDIILRFGKYVRTRKERSEQSMEADIIKMHPAYEPVTYNADIALIRASKRVIFTDYIQPICLPSTRSDYELLRVNSSGIISGWGKRKEHKHIARRLHEATVPIVSHAKCSASHPRYVITANMFCAGHKNSSLGDACQGDSGGPFSMNNPERATPSLTRHVLVGVVSWGDGCGRYGKYGVYTRLTNFIDWIMSQIID